MTKQALPSKIQIPSRWRLQGDQIARPKDIMEQVEVARQEFEKYKRQYQTYLDAVVPYTKERWGALAALLVVFVLRILLVQGFYVVTYALFIFLLNLLLAFLTPKFDLSVQDDIRSEEVEEGGGLPVSQNDEFRPFIRRLPEFKFWLNAIRATALALFCTLLPFLDVPVFWPILVFYFIVLLILTMRRQIQHMIKYRYIPFDVGKKKFGSK